MKNFYFRLLSLALFMLVGTSAFSQSCQYELVLIDSWGDGWNGNTIDVDIAGTVTNHTLSSGSLSSIPLTIVDGSAVTLTYNAAGSYSNENGYELRDAGGAVVLSDGMPLSSAGTNSSGTAPSTAPASLVGGADCPKCDFELVLIDSWGDGWNGNTIDVDIAGTVTNHTLSSGSLSSIPLTIVDGSAVTLTYLGGGSYSNENGYELRDPGGTVVLSDGMPLSSAGTNSSGTAPSTTPAPLVGGAVCPSCLPTANLATANVTATSADLSWDAIAGAVGYTYEIVPAGNGQGNGTVATATVTGTTASITGLAAQTTYDVYVTTDCGAAQSNPVSISFTTLCTIVTAPWMEDFTASSTPNCWSESGSESWKYSTGADYAAGSAGDHTGNGGNYAWIDGSSPNGASQISTLTSGLVDVSGLTNPQLSFWVYSHNTNGSGYNTLTVEVYDGAAWNTASTINSDQGNGWVNVTFDLSTLTITGAVQVRFTIAENSPSGSFYNDILIDDVELREAPSCPEPSVLAAAVTSATTADLSWTENGTATSWDIEIVAAGTAATGTPTTSGVTNPYTATGLSAETAYDYYVRADCGGGDLSAWVGPKSFMTGVEVDCVLNETLCYDNQQYNWSYASSNANPVTITFITGDIENNYDELYVYDSDGTLLNPTQPYGNSGDLTALTWTSTGTTISMFLDPDGSFSCADGQCCSTSWEWTVSNDIMAPTMACQDISVQLDATGNASITAMQIDNGSSDNCAFTMALDVTDFTCANVGANTVTLTGTDDAGNSATCTATVTVVDSVMPTAMCQDITVQLDATGNASITAVQIDNSSADACGVASLSVMPNAFTCANLGANTVTLTVTDNNGNSSTCTATVTVEDVTNPMVTASDFTLALGCGGTDATLTLANVNASATDACTASPTMALSKELFTSADIGANTVTVTATDDAGLEGTMDVTVTVFDPSLLFVNDDATGDNNGTSWANAYTDLQDALAAVGACPETNVWVAAGTYVPGTMRTSTFDVPANVKLIGGLAGSEAGDYDISTRDSLSVAGNLTILSGDVDGNDAASPVVDAQTEIMGNNAYTVVTLQNGVLDFSGFTVTAGKADAAGNTAPLGWKSGAGILNMGTPEMYELMLNGNYAKAGAAIYNAGEGTGSDASPMMDKITFMGNYSEFDGACIYNDGRAGGEASPTVTNSVFMGNKSGSASAGVYNNGRIGGSSAPTFMMCTFAGNEAPNGGVAMVNDEADVTLAMVSMTGNTNGNGQLASPIVDFNSTVAISASNVEGYYQNQMNQDPAFMVAPSPATAATTWNLALKASSPLIGMGDNTVVPAWITKDRAGNARIQEGTIDIGAFESPYAAAALPVELVSFTGTAREAKSVLTWTTAAEYNTAYFNVEHSIDGKNFVALGKVAAAGESTIEVAYNFTHELPAAGINYYRLQMMDNDNTFEYSNVVALTFEKGAIAIFPNPADDHVVISIGNEVTFNEDIEISIYNSIGQLIQTVETAETNKEINITNLPAGTYTVRINADGQLFNEQIIITH